MPLSIASKSMRFLRQPADNHPSEPASAGLAQGLSRVQTTIGAPERPLPPPADIVIMGGGPVGLLAASQLKLRKPEIDIIVFEKYSSYQRDNLIHLGDAPLAKCQNDRAGMMEKLKQQLAESPLIKIQALETDLKELAITAGVTIKVISNQDGSALGVKHVQTELIDRYPNAKMFIGCDGANSVFRSQMFASENFHKEPFRYVALIKCAAVGRAQSVPKISELYPLLKRNHYHLADITVGKYDENHNTTPVTIQIFIPEAIYLSLEGRASFKTPISLSGAPQLPPELHQDINNLLGLQMINGASRLDLATAVLNVVKISQHYSEVTLECRGGVHIGLLGDADLGLSFFQGAKAGLECAGKFAQTVTDNWHKLNQRDTESDPQFMASCKRLVHGAAKVQPTQFSQGNAVVVVNSIARSRVRLVEKNPDTAELAITAYDSVLGLSSQQAHTKASLVAGSYPFHDYSLWHAGFSQQRLAAGREKNQHLGLTENLIHISSVVPWQVLAYRSSQLEELSGAVSEAMANPMAPIAKPRMRAAPSAVHAIRSACGL